MHLLRAPSRVPLASTFFAHFSAPLLQRGLLHTTAKCDAALVVTQHGVELWDSPVLVTYHSKFQTANSFLKVYKDRAKFVSQYANDMLKSPIKGLKVVFEINLGSSGKIYREKCHGHLISVCLEERKALSLRPDGTPAMYSFFSFLSSF